MNRVTVLIGVIVASVMICAGGVVVVFGGLMASACVPTSASSGAPSTPTPREGWDTEQRANAATIVTVGMSMQVPPRGWVIALATAMQESNLHNLGNLGARNDHDSLGLFQQRPSQGWGTPEQIMNPQYATMKFYQKLLTVPGWQTMSLTEAAQAVQKSAYPDAYAKHEAAATALAFAIAGDPTGCVGGLTAAGWLMPVAGPVVSGFRTAARPDHDGIDIAAPKGTPIQAAASGVVIRVECNASLDGRPYACDRDGSVDVAGCGFYSEVLHPGNIVSRYCHQLVRPALVVGQAVAAGQFIGIVGTSGNSSGPHLHLEIHQGNPATRANALDPAQFLRSVGVPVPIA